MADNNTGLILLCIWYQDEMDLQQITPFFHHYPTCQTEHSWTLQFIGSNDPRLLPADQSHVNACCLDEERGWRWEGDGQGLGFLENHQNWREGPIPRIKRCDGVSKNKVVHVHLWPFLPPVISGFKHDFIITLTSQFSGKYAQIHI